LLFFQAEDGIRDLVRSRGLGDVYKRQGGDRPILYVRNKHVKNILEALKFRMLQFPTLQLDKQFGLKCYSEHA